MKPNKRAVFRLLFFYFVVSILAALFGLSVKQMVEADKQNAEYIKELQREIQEDHSQLIPIDKSDTLKISKERTIYIYSVDSHDSMKFTNNKVQYVK